MGEHYGAVIIPARPYKPRDKAKVEAAVLLAERWILACLRNRTFFSIGEANMAIAELLEKLNNKPFQKMDGSRRSLYEELERPVLRPLPAHRYEYGEWSKHKVNIDYHIEVDDHRYSVPHELIHQTLEARSTATTVEVMLRGSRVASHVRSYVRGGFTTVPEHMPSSHRRYAEWTPARIERWAAQTGPNTADLAAKIMASRPHPEQGFRSCMWIMSLGTKHGASRLEAAATRALAINAVSARSIESILKKGLETQPLPERFRATSSTKATTPTTNRHDNVRGADYYQ
jgi:transposase